MRIPIASALCAAFLMSTPIATQADARASAVHISNVTFAHMAELLSAQYGMPILADPSLTQYTVTMTLPASTLDEVFDMLRETYHVGAKKVGHGYVIEPLANIARSTSVHQVVIETRNVKASEIAPTLQAALPPDTVISPDPRLDGRRLVISGSPDAIARARSLVDAFDRPLYGDSGNLRTEFIPLYSLKPDIAAQLLIQAVTPVRPQTIVASLERNGVVVQGSDDFISQVKSVALQLDQPGDSVKIEVKVIDVTPKNDNKNVGVQFGGTDGNGTAQPGTFAAFAAITGVGVKVAVNATINALLETANARLFASPNVTTLNNESATVKIVDSVPILVNGGGLSGAQSVRFVDAGVILSVTPSIGADGLITVAVDATYSQITGFDAFSHQPNIGSRQVTSKVRLADGEGIAYGGLFNEVSTDTLQKLPVLGSLPLFGGIFRNRQATGKRDEIVFLIIPHRVTAASKEADAQHFEELLRNGDAAGRTSAATPEKNS